MVRRSCLRAPEHSTRLSKVRTPDVMDEIGREVLSDEEASPNYRIRQARRRRTGEESWEVVDANSGIAVATGLVDRDEALRVVRGWERLSQKLEGGLDGHLLVN